MGIGVGTGSYLLRFLVILEKERIELPKRRGHGLLSLSLCQVGTHKEILLCLSDSVRDYFNFQFEGLTKEGG